RPSGAPSGGRIDPTATLLHLDDPTQYQLAWTTYQDVWKDSQDLVTPFAATLSASAKPDELFSPPIAHSGLPLTLLVVEKAPTESLGELAERFGDDFVDDE